MQYTWGPQEGFLRQHGRWFGVTSPHSDSPSFALGAPMLNVRARLNTATTLFMSTAFKPELLSLLVLFRALIYSYSRHLHQSWTVQLSIQLLRSMLPLGTASAGGVGSLSPPPLALRLKAPLPGVKASLCRSFIKQNGHGESIRRYSAQQRQI